MEAGLGPAEIQNRRFYKRIKLAIDEILAWVSWSSKMVDFELEFNLKLLKSEPGPARAPNNVDFEW